MIAQIRPVTFPHWILDQGSAVPLLLDVRETWEFNTASVRPLGHASAFDVLSIPMQEIPARLAELPTDRPIACLCHHGIRSQNVARYLVQNGFQSVVNIAGGIEAWSLELDPSVPCY
jgi:rhodanese-related sulfurtransferase